MTTKAELIAQFKAEHPTLTKMENGEIIQLDAKEYEGTISTWADNTLQAQADESAKVAKANAKIAAQAKLAALGLTPDEVAAIVGN